jgi:uncharacterized membrane protein SpoIIM required for sporulation
MILDLPRFIETERSYWMELDRMTAKIESEAAYRMDIAELQRFHYLYERCSADLAKMATFSAEAEVQEHLGSIVARAYGEIHSTPARPKNVRPLRWLFYVFPRTFRRHVRLFWLAMAITVFGASFGAFALLTDPDAKAVLMPFSALEESPADRVAQEESGKNNRLAGQHATFAAYLMQNNIRVSIMTLTFGVTWGAGTTIVLFSNGVGLGAVSADYVHAGQSKFLLGWLLPHGVIEIPAILIAGQAGFLLAGAMIGWGRRGTRRERLRSISGDLITLTVGVAVMLVWAGLVESFLSQYHKPVLPYELKIGFGLVEAILLTLFLGLAGTGDSAGSKSE